MKKYSFSDTVVFVGGVEITGFADGDDVITAERRVDSAIGRVGAGGEMTVGVSADRSGTISLNLMQASSSIVVLNGFLIAQENDVFVPLPILFKDGFNNEILTATNCFITKLAPMARGVGVNTSNWSFTAERLDLIKT